MASQRLATLYAKARKANVGCIVGEDAISAWRAAKIVAKWDALESIGAVRLRDEDDTDFTPDPGNCCCDDPDCSAKTGPAVGTMSEYRTDFENMAEWEYADTYRDDRSGIPWKEADSVWGSTGYRDATDWRENAYILDHMAEAIDQFKAAWKAYVAEQRERRAGVCPTCHGSGRV